MSMSLPDLVAPTVALFLAAFAVVVVSSSLNFATFSLKLTSVSHPRERRLRVLYITRLFRLRCFLCWRSW